MISPGSQRALRLTPIVVAHGQTKHSHRAAWKGETTCQCLCYNSDADGTLRRPSASVWSSSLASLEIANIHFWSIIGPSVRVIGLEVVFDGVLELTLWRRSGSLNNLQPPFHVMSRSAGRVAPIPEGKPEISTTTDLDAVGMLVTRIVPQKDPLVNACAHFHRSLWCQHVYIINRTVHRNSHEIRAWHGAPRCIILGVTVAISRQRPAQNRPRTLERSGTLCVCLPVPTAYCGEQNKPSELRSASDP